MKNFEVFFLRKKTPSSIEFRSVRNVNFSVSTRWQNLLFIYLFGENLIFRKDMESPLIFVLFFKGKKRKK